MLNNLLKFFVILAACLLAFISYSFNQGPVNKNPFGKVFFFPKDSKTLQINGEKVFPRFNPENTIYEPLTISTLQQNTISNGKITYTFNLKSITENALLYVFIGAKKYYINLFNPNSMPTYSLLNESTDSGYYFLTPSKTNNCKISAAYILNEKGQLLYYRRNGKIERCVSDFKKITLPNGKVRYTLMLQEKKMPPFIYWLGSLLVMDENFKPIKNLKLLKHNNHGMLPVENHHSVYLDDNHYILSSYWPTEIFDKDENPVKITAPVIQEIKDGKVVFEFNGANYPDFTDSALLYYNPLSSGYKDFWHYNNLEIDPRDNNWILSFSNQGSVVKIDKKTGKILWILGGLYDEFKLNHKQFFFFQHTPVLTKDGYLMIYDNGGNRNSLIRNKPRISNSRILKFKLDEKEKKVIDFKAIQLPFYSFSMGSAYEVNENTLVVSGGSNKKHAVTEVDLSTNNLHFIFSLDNTETYRAYKYKTLH